MPFGSQLISQTLKAYERIGLIMETYFHSLYSRGSSSSTWCRTICLCVCTCCMEFFIGSRGTTQEHPALDFIRTPYFRPETSSKEDILSTSRCLRPWIQCFQKVAQKHLSNGSRWHWVLIASVSSLHARHRSEGLLYISAWKPHNNSLRRILLFSHSR